MATAGRVALALLGAAGDCGMRQIRALAGVRVENRRLRDLEAARAAVLQFAVHEIRTPLSVALGYVDLVESGSLGQMSPEARDALSMARSRLGEVEALVGQLAEAARMREGASQLRLNDRDLRDVMTKSAERVRQAAAGSHQVNVILPESAVPVGIDDGRIGMVLSNLLENAIKYSPGGGEVRCEVHAGHGQAVLTVADRGVGVDPEQFDKLFQPFSRLGRTAALERPGLGLGLYLAREIARAHGGELDARPNSDRGTVFTLTLPLLPQSRVFSPG